MAELFAPIGDGWSGRWGVKLWTGKIDSSHDSYHDALARVTELYELNPIWQSSDFPVGYLRIVPVEN